MLEARWGSGFFIDCFSICFVRITHNLIINLLVYLCRIFVQNSARWRTQNECKSMTVIVWGVMGSVFVRTKAYFPAISVLYCCSVLLYVYNISVYQLTTTLYKYLCVCIWICTFTYIYLALQMFMLKDIYAHIYRYIKTEIDWSTIPCWFILVNHCEYRRLSSYTC